MSLPPFHPASHPPFPETTLAHLGSPFTELIPYPFAVLQKWHRAIGLQGKSQAKAGGTKRARGRHSTLCVKFPLREDTGTTDVAENIFSQPPWLYSTRVSKHPYLHEHNRFQHYSSSVRSWWTPCLKFFLLSPAMAGWPKHIMSSLWTTDVFRLKQNNKRKNKIKIGNVSKFNALIFHFRMAIHFQTYFKVI